MKFLTKRNHKAGWYLVKPIMEGVKYELTIHDGTSTHCEDVRCGSISEAYDHCKARIDAA